MIFQYKLELGFPYSFFFFFFFFVKLVFLIVISCNNVLCKENFLHQDFSCKSISVL
jgi:hypothetical protein